MPDERDDDWAKNLGLDDLADLGRTLLGDTDPQRTAAGYVRESANLELPARLVDASLVSWVHVGAGMYRPEGRGAPQLPVPLYVVDEHHGPTRRVGPPPDEQIEGVARLLAACGPVAVGTLAYALAAVTAALVLRAGPGANRALYAGRPLCWEAEAMRAAQQLGLDVPSEHAETAAAQVLAKTLGEWATGDPTPNLPELLSEILGRVVDRLGAGWEGVTDEWLRARTDIDLVRKWVLERSATPWQAP